MEPEPAIITSAVPANPAEGKEAAERAKRLRRWFPQDVETIRCLAADSFNVDDLDQLRTRAKSAGWVTTTGGRGKGYGASRIGFGLPQPVRKLLPAGHAGKQRSLFVWSKLGGGVIGDPFRVQMYGPQKTNAVHVAVWADARSALNVGSNPSVIAAPPPLPVADQQWTQASDGVLQDERMKKSPVAFEDIARQLNRFSRARALTLTLQMWP